MYFTNFSLFCTMITEKRASQAAEDKPPLTVLSLVERALPTQNRVQISTLYPGLHGNHALIQLIYTSTEFNISGSLKYP